MPYLRAGRAALKVFSVIAPSIVSASARSFVVPTRKPHSSTSFSEPLGTLEVMENDSEQSTSAGDGTRISSGERSSWRQETMVNIVKRTAMQLRSFFIWIKTLNEYPKRVIKLLKLLQILNI